jgi:protein required for attachment to host cells
VALPINQESAMRDTIWVVITDGATARICSSEDGVTTLLPTLGAVENFAGADEAFEPSERWISSPRVQPSFKRQFASELARILSDGASEEAYDGLIVIAAPRIMGELRNALAPETRKRLIGEIVRDLPETIPDCAGHTWH